MKITVSQEFDTPEAAMVFLALVGAAPASKPLRATSEAAVPPAGAAPSAEKTRKTRADAGQPRGPYKDKDAAPVAEAATTAVATSVPTASAAPVAAPAPIAAPSAVAPKAPGTSTQEPPSGAAPTYADATAALREMNKVKGLGMDACVGLLADYGAIAVSKLKPEQLPDFIAAIKARIAGAAKK